MSRNATNPLPSAAVAITVRILSGTDEDLNRPELRPGQRSWWIQRTDGHDRPWLDTGGRYRGTEPATFTVGLQPGGKYLVGVGTETRIRFLCPITPCTMAVDPITGSANVVPTLAVVPGYGAEAGPPCEAWHVRNAPIGSQCRGITYASGADAFQALSCSIQAGSIPTTDVAAGRIGVTRGSWPVASYPPPAPPCEPCATHYGDNGPCDEGKPVASPHRTTVTPLADVLPTPTIPPAPERTAAPAGFSWKTAEERVSAVAVDRIRADESYLATVRDVDGNGLVLPPPVRTFGGAVNSTGRENVCRSHAEWRDEPRTVDTLQAIVDSVRTERRTDVPILLGHVWMSDDGTVMQAPTYTGPVTDDTPLRDLGGTDLAPGGLQLERTALADLVSFHGGLDGTLPRAGQVMPLLPSKVRADVWNAQNTGRSLDGVVLRTRSVGGTSERRSAYAVVSQGYSPCDADLVAHWTRQALLQIPGGTEARGAAEYNPETTGTTVDAVWHADNVVDFAAGDIFKMGVRVTSKDNGTGAIRVSLVAFRNLCFNLIITSETAHNMARIVHRGTQQDMIDRLVQGISHVGKAAAPFLARWGHLRTAPLSTLLVNPSEDRTLNLRAIFAELAGTVDPNQDTPEVRPDAIPTGVAFEGIGDPQAFIAACLRSYAHEPGGTLADVVNAITGLHRELVPVGVLRQAESNAGRLVDAWGA